MNFMNSPPRYLLAPDPPPPPTQGFRISENSRCNLLVITQFIRTVRKSVELVNYLKAYLKVAFTHCRDKEKLLNTAERRNREDG